MNSDRKPTSETYNVIGEKFDQARSKDLSMERRHLEMMTSRLRKGASVLDLGCGSGRPIARFLLDAGFRVIAIDGSKKMIDLAKRFIPEAEISLQDMTAFEIENPVDAVLMWHSSFHLSRDDQRRLLPRLRNNLKPGGYLMFTSGTVDGETSSDNFGEQLYHATLSTAEYRRMLEELGFEVIKHTTNDASAGGATVWFAQLTSES